MWFSVEKQGIGSAFFMKKGTVWVEYGVGQILQCQWKQSYPH